MFKLLATKNIKLLCSLYCILIIMCSTPSFAQDRSYPCLENIEQEFDSIGKKGSIKFCSDFHEGWNFGLSPNLGHNGIATHGSILRLFNFRQPDWKRGEENTLSFRLIPYKKNTFAIHIKDGDKIHDRQGKRTYFLWARDIRTPIGNVGPYGNKWNPVRFFRCLTLIGHGCVTYYDVVICRDYYPPSAPFYRHRRIEPQITISAATPESSDDLLENFDQAHNLIEEVLERLLEHSCQKRN